MRRTPAALLGLLLLLPAAGCGEGDVGEARQLVQGDAASGRRIMEREGCGACHRIPGVTGARGRVGPSLAGFLRQGYIAGEFPNRPALLARWLRDAPAMIPRTVMPAFDLTEREVQDVMAHLYRLD